MGRSAGSAHFDRHSDLLWLPLAFTNQCHSLLRAATSSLNCLLLGKIRQLSTDGIKVGALCSHFERSEYERDPLAAMLICHSASSFKQVKPHIPLIRFRKGGNTLNQTNASSTSSVKTVGSLEETMTPIKYRRKTLSQLEIDTIEVGTGGYSQELVIEPQPNFAPYFLNLHSNSHSLARPNSKEDATRRSSSSTSQSSQFATRLKPTFSCYLRILFICPFSSHFRMTLSPEAYKLAETFSLKVISSLKLFLLLK